MKTLDTLKKSVNKKGYVKALTYHVDFLSLVQSMKLTPENEQYATVYYNDNTMFKYEQATEEKSEGVRVINYNSITRRNEFRIFRKK